MGCCSLSARQAGSAGTGQDEVELLQTGRSRKWSISEGQSEGSLLPKDPVALSETEDTEALWGRTREELVNLLITQPISGWEGINIHCLGEIVWSSLVFLRSYRMEEMCECYIVLFSFHLLILSVDHTKKAFVYEGLLPLAGMRMREVVSAISNTFEIAGSMTESRLVCCQNSADFDMWVQHLQNQIEKANANCPVSHNSIISFLDSEERLLILFPEDLLFLSVDKERTAITYEGKLPLTGIQAKEKSAMLGKLQFEITGSLTEPILITCSTAEDYEKCLFHLQKPEENLDSLTLQPPPIIPKKSWR
ncbi:uncharacterized protein LOC112970093 isoform X2 [Apteryx rowi]|uniref:uncharacterized protein LOC112970093 isoform X2 n=1 Tax=Apteryx rowi TaxID=308060 RepID=UPI000E1D4DCC|nr:uncharacterized protein LOC112970093 isoform X2 [Apteryx rowi]